MLTSWKEYSGRHWKTPGGQQSRKLQPNMICLLNVISFYDSVTHWADLGKLVDIIFLDFSKIFDTVSHRILLDKMCSTAGQRDPAERPQQISEMSSHQTHEVWHGQVLDSASGMGQTHIDEGTKGWTVPLWKRIKFETTWGTWIDTSQ